MYFGIQLEHESNQGYYMSEEIWVSSEDISYQYLTVIHL